MAGLFSPRFIEFGPSRYRPADIVAEGKRIRSRSVDVLREKVRKHAPRSPGIYGMLDRHQSLIYVGKAKSLRSRLMSYFRENSRDPKAGRIMANTRTILWEQTGTEFAALLRELELIQRFLPRYNVQGVPGYQRYCYVCLGRGPVPYAFVVAKPTGKELACYGPIAKHGRAAEAVRKLNQWFMLRDCPQKQRMVFSDQPELFTIDRSPGCLRYELQTCLGPCVGACTRSDHQNAFEGAKAFLEGRNLSPLTTLESQMADASKALQFERAAALRDKWVELGWLVDRLTWVRQARDQQSFIYASTNEDGRTVWYMTHFGQIRATVLEPCDDDSRVRTLRIIGEVFRDLAPAATMLPVGQVDHVLLVSAWFNKHPDERARILTVDAAIGLCKVREVVAIG